MKRFTIADLSAWKRSGKKWSVITSYDSVTASIFDEAGIPVLLVGDSAGNNFLGEENTVPVTVEELIPLTRAVVRGSNQALVVADLPFGSYEINSEQALATGIRFLKEGKAQAVKLEGGVRVIEQVKALVKYGIPVMGHLGMTPQSVNALGGFKVQGRGESGQLLIDDAKALEAAGCFAIVLELIPAELAAQITATLSIPTVGIGAGVDCDAQVLVWTDLMGMTPSRPKFARAYRNLRNEMINAAREWSDDVAAGKFPSEGETFH
ncbi:MAG: 3-methyl-2-oxobutanoate hydroxymethyltransferase [Candidatus Nanopelagicaceae bacterium]